MTPPDINYRSIVESASVLIWVADTSGGCVWFNRMWLQFTGRTLEQEFHSGWTTGVHSDDLDRCLAIYTAAFAARQPFSMEYRLRHHSGEYRWIVDNGAPLYDDQCAFLGYAGACWDISDRKAGEERIRHMAQFDFLTDLPNRALFYDRLDQLLTSAQRYQRHFALLFIDLDNFKPINDTHGHEMGDEVLRLVARRLVSQVRASDTVARHGGDEFVLLAPEIDTPAEAVSLAAKIVARLGEPLPVRGQILSVSCSVGIAIYPQDGRDVSTLIQAADGAMYLAKTGGRNAWRMASGDATPT